MKMLLIITMLLLTTTVVNAGDNAPDFVLWPEEKDYNISILMGEIPHCTVTNDCCSTYNLCSVAYNRPPAPVPLPFSGALLVLGLAGLMLWRMR